MHLSFFLKIVAVIYLFWYVVNILVDVVRGNTAPGSGHEKEIIQLGNTPGREQLDAGENNSDASDRVTAAPAEAVQVSLEMLKIPATGQLKRKSGSSVIADLGLEILSKPGLNVSEMTNQDINDYDFI